VYCKTLHYPAFYAAQRLFIGALLLLCIMLGGVKVAWGQVAFFSENTGSSPVPAPVNTYTGWENTIPVTFSGSADVRNTSPSNGYIGSSGEGNVFFTSTNGTQLTIAGINTTAYTGITLSLGHFKSTTAGNNELFIEVSSDGANYTQLTYSRPTGVGTAIWRLINPTGAIPSITNLRIRFRQTSTTTQFRIDDIKLTGTLNPCNVTISSFSPTSGPVGTLVTINGTNFSGATEVRFNGIPQSTFSLISSNLITARVPAGATSGPISVFTDCNGLSSTNFTVLGKSCPYGGTGLIISELCDPFSNYQTDRFIEIYNPTNSTVNLTNWVVRAISNGNINDNCGLTKVLCWTLSGSIAPGQALTCGFTSPTSGGPHNFINPQWITTNVSSNITCFNWNGQYQDGAALYNNSGIRIDGILRQSGSSTLWFDNKSLVRNADVCDPNANSLYTEWYPTEEVTIAGELPATPRSHTSTCSGETPVISSHPVSQFVCAGGGPITFSVAASGGTTPYQYKWYVHNGANWQLITNGGNYSGATTANLTVSNVPIGFNNYQYYCEVYNSDGLCYATSNAAQLTVNSNPTATATNNSPFCEPGTLQFTGSASGGTGPYSWAWSGPGSYTYSEQNPSIANATPDFNGEYTLTVTDANGCIGTASTYVSISALPATPTLSASTSVCDGSTPVFTAGGGSIYEFYVNGVLKQGPSTANTFTPPEPLIAGQQVCVRSVSPFVFNGTFEGDWGTPLATSAGGPPSSSFGADNNIDALYLQTDADFIYGAIAGNILSKDQSDRVLVFIDCQPGGYRFLNDWTDRGGAPYEAMRNLDIGIEFDEGFEPDYILGINRNYGNTYFNLYNMQANSDNYLGQNGNGLLGFSANSGTGDYNNGFEFAIPRAAFGLPTGAFKVFVMLTNQPSGSNHTYLSNQFLTHAENTATDYGDIPVYFWAAEPDPVSIGLFNTACYSENCLTVNALPTVSISGNNAFCTGSSTLLTANASAGSGTISAYQWYLGGNPISGAVNATYTVTAPGNYTVTVINSNGCSATSAAFNVTENPLPTTSAIYHQ